MTDKLSRRSLFHLGVPEVRQFSIDRYYRKRKSAAEEPPVVEIRAELLGPVETSQVGLGDCAEGASRAELTLPEVQDQQISWQRVEQLFFDLAQQAELLEVRFKAAAKAYATPGPASLPAAHEALKGRIVDSVQLRYRHRGRQWLDTLIPGERGVRIVRIAVHP